MAEFKKLSEVELTENISDTTTVLIEEAGDIKRAPKSKVGGAAGLIVTVTEEALSYLYNNGIFVITENYDNVYDTLCKGGQVWLDASIMNENSVAPTVLESSGSGGSSSDIPRPSVYGQAMGAVINWMLTDVGLMCEGILGGEALTALFPNGSHNIEVEESLPK